MEAMIEVVIPAMRTPARLVESLAKGTHRPSLVTIVSNECDRFDTFGLDVRILRFESKEYCYGDHDVVLRRNIGIWHARGDHIVFQDDDQIAPANMITQCEERFREGPMFWGHHRYADLSAPTEEIIRWDPSKGRSRETSANRWHGYFSAYAGMMGARTTYLRDHLGGFDMAFMGRHAGEDQQLGKRFMYDVGSTGIWVCEPPFSWHPEQPVPRRVLRTNSCRDHELVEERRPQGVVVERCTKCPFVRRCGRLDTDYLMEPFRPKLVMVESVDAQLR